MRNLKLTISFLGTAYHGYQVQKNALGVANVLQDAITAVTGERVELKGCSRTDAGVHAREFVCSFKTDSPIPCEKLPLALNGHLPRDIGVLGCEEMPLEFHARYSAKGKEYRYLIYNSARRNPFYEATAWRHAPGIDEKRINCLAQDFVGRHDFTAFCALGRAPEDPVREIFRFRVEREEELVSFTVAGSGFLYNMVRIMVGTLVSLGEGKLRDERPSAILLGKDRDKAGFTAPAHGLCLTHVYY